MLQVTPLFDVSLFTTAVISDVPPADTVPTDAVTETEITARSTFTDADFAGSVAEVAVMVTIRSLEGGVAGAA